MNYIKKKYLTYGKLSLKASIFLFIDTIRFAGITL